MNGRDGGPLSPVSVGDGSEWSGISKYQSIQNDSPYSNNRGQLATPPISSGSNGTMNGGGFSQGPGAQSPSNGPSPPASIARSSNGASLYNGTTMNGANDSRNRKDEQFEASLSEHYQSLKRYLAASLRDEKGNPRPNKARDKLLRLSPVQFQELSTDVFDELLRRQAAARRGPDGGLPNGGPPQYLLPKDEFHPKRNQARQKLSTLPPARFRDLATDVFYELERRFPHFAGEDMPRPSSAASMRGPPSRIGTPADGFRPGSRGGPRIRRPSEASIMSSVSTMSAYPPRGESRSASRSGVPMNGMSSPGLPPNDYGRPLPKTFQSNTIVPNKSTMVEDDDDPTGGEDNDDEDAFGLENAARGRMSQSNGGRSEVIICL
jgi:Spa2 homology domain (SHD) of GIT